MIMLYGPAILAAIYGESVEKALEECDVETFLKDLKDGIVGPENS